MVASKFIALSAALLAAVNAAPNVERQHEERRNERHHHHHNRDIVWQTEIDEVLVTELVTATVWIEPGQSPPAEAHPQGYSSMTSTAEPAPAAYTPPAPPAPAYTPQTSSSSVYVAPPPAYTPEPSTSSVYVAPPPAYTPPSSSSVYVAPTPESTSEAPAPTSYAAPPPAESSSAPSYGGGDSSSGALTFGIAKSGTSFTGDLTYYSPEAGIGACGGLNDTSQPVVAISHAIFESYNTGNPNNNPLCWKWLTIHGKDGSMYKAQIVDKCPGCDFGSLDLTQPMFDDCTSGGDGRVSGMTWTMD